MWKYACNLTAHQIENKPWQYNGYVTGSFPLSGASSYVLATTYLSSICLIAFQYHIEWHVCKETIGWHQTFTQPSQNFSRVEMMEYWYNIVTKLSQNCIFFFLVRKTKPELGCLFHTSRQANYLIWNIRPSISWYLAQCNPIW